MIGEDDSWNEVDPATLFHLLAMACEMHGQRGFAAKNGVSVSYVNSIMNGRVPLSDRIAAMFGYSRKVTFVRSPDAIGNPIEL